MNLNLFEYMLSAFYNNILVLLKYPEFGPHRAIIGYCISFLGLLDNLPQSWWCKTTDSYFLTVLGARSSIPVSLG